MPDVAGWGANKARYRRLFRVLGHVNPGQRILIVKQRLCKRPGKQGLANTCRSKEKERTHRPARIGQTGTTSPHRIGDHPNRTFLPNHSPAQRGLKRQQLLDLRLNQPGHRNPCP